MNKIFTNFKDHNHFLNYIYFILERKEKHSYLYRGASKALKHIKAAAFINMSAQMNSGHANHQLQNSGKQIVTSDFSIYPIVSLIASMPVLLHSLNLRLPVERDVKHVTRY